MEAFSEERLCCVGVRNGIRHLHHDIKRWCQLVAEGARAHPHNSVHPGDAGGGLSIAAEEPGVVRKVRTQLYASCFLHSCDIGLGRQLHVPEGKRHIKRDDNYEFDARTKNCETIKTKDFCAVSLQHLCLSSFRMKRRDFPLPLHHDGKISHSVVVINSLGHPSINMI